MRKLYLISIIIIVLILSACGNEEKINSLQQEANALVMEEKFEEAILIYEEIINLSEEEIYVEELDNIKQLQEQKIIENQMIVELKEMRESLVNIQREELAKPKSEIAYIDLYYIVSDLKGIYEYIDKLEMIHNDEINDYISKLKEAQSAKKPTMETIFNQDYATSSEKARNKDTATPALGGELGALLRQLDSLEEINKSFAIDDIDNYVNGLVSIELPNFD